SPGTTTSGGTPAASGTSCGSWAGPCNGRGAGSARRHGARADMAKRTVEDVELTGRRVFLRVDFNVPLGADGQVTEDARIRAVLPTLGYIRQRGARIILASHLGRPKGKPDPKYSLAPVARRLGALLGEAVSLAADCVGSPLEAAARALAP